MVSIRRLQKFMMYDEIENTGKSESMINGKGDLNNIMQVNIMKTLKEEETGKEKDAQQIPHDQGDLGESDDRNEYIISIESASAKWVEHEKEDTLQDITIKVKPGELIAVVGQVGSGKSSLLNVILKELPLRTGAIKVCVFYFSY